MLKLAGASILFAAAFFYGGNMCEKTKKKLTLIEALGDLISYIGESIETFRLPLGRIFEDYQNGFLQEIGFLDILRRDGFAAAICSVEKDLPPEVFDQLCSFAGAIGGGYASEQAKLCAFTKERLCGACVDLRAQLPGRLKMYRLLPLLAAASVLLLII